MGCSSWRTAPEQVLSMGYSPSKNGLVQHGANMGHNFCWEPAPAWMPHGLQLPSRRKLTDGNMAISTVSFQELQGKNMLHYSLLAGDEPQIQHMEHHPPSFLTDHSCCITFFTLSEMFSEAAPAQQRACPAQGSPWPPTTEATPAASLLLKPCQVNQMHPDMSRKKFRPFQNELKFLWNF